MKPRAMSEWMDSAASSAVWPCRSVHERGLRVPHGEEDDQPERLLEPEHDGVEGRRPRAELGRLLGRELRQLHLERAVDASRAVLERYEWRRRQRLELARELAAPGRQRLTLVEVDEQPLGQLNLLALRPVAGLRLLPHSLEPALDVVAVGEDELEAEGLQVGRWIGPLREPVEHGEERIRLA